MNINTNKEPELLSQTQYFSEVLAAACQQVHAILDACGEDDETLEASSVTVSCKFLLDLVECLLEMSYEYEDFDATEHFELIELQKQYGGVFKSDTRH